MTDDVPLPIRKTWTIIRSAARQPKNLLLITLISITGGFFYLQKNGLPPLLRAKGMTTESVLDGIVEQQMCLSQLDLEQDRAKKGSLVVKTKQSVDCLLPKTEPAKNNSGTETVAIKKDSTEATDLEQELYSLVGDAPIREMVPAIAKRDRKTAAFVVGIAKKESSWGEHAPTREGERCYNYWGYKGEGSRGTAMGYGCFATPEEGVNAIADRIEKLSRGKELTPASLVVWKCGNLSCEGHDPEGVRSWIGTVATYYQKIAERG